MSANHRVRVLSDLPAESLRSIGQSRFFYCKPDPVNPGGPPPRGLTDSGEILPIRDPYVARVTRLVARDQPAYEIQDRSQK